jgi:RNA polymerase sigma-70 factor (ECF subfamily)
MKAVPEVSATDGIDHLLVAMRPRLHRYCARMVGSVIDGEDVLQDALIKAVESFGSTGPVHNPEGWLFRIAHNTALDFLRRRNRQEALRSGEEVDMIADQLDAVLSRQIASMSLRTFMRLPVAQRSSVILMDVLGCSLQEICEVMDMSLPAVKAALHRGRTQLREFANEPEDVQPPKLSDADRTRLSAYVTHFNARDFDAIRTMIADDVRLELVNKTRLNGKAEVSSRYFRNYSRLSDWHMVPGLVEGHPAILVFDPNAPGSEPQYFILLNWQADKVATIRDFRHAPYVIEGAQYRL